MTKDEALRLALEALERYVNEDEVMEGMRGNEPWVETKRMGEQAITAIKAALEVKDEPDKYAMDIECTNCGAKQSGVLTVHTTPPQRKPLTDEQPEVRTGNCLRVGVCASEGHKIQPQRTWVGLTDEEIIDRANNEVFAEAFARGVAWTEAKLKEKNT